jgi:hypothetical protein
LTIGQWALPTHPEDFKTFIDHGWTLDLQNYPIYPNGQTVYVKPANTDIKNFLSAGFTRTAGVEYQSNRNWKVIQIYCLGVMVCDVKGYQWAGFPPTAQKSIEKFLAG